LIEHRRYLKLPTIYRQIYVMQIAGRPAATVKLSTAVISVSGV